MNDAILVALITGGFSLLGIFISAKSTQEKVTSELHTQNEIQNVKIENIISTLHSLGDKHDDLSSKLPKISTEVNVLETRVTNLEHRVQNLENHL